MRLRALAWFAIAAQACFVVSWIVAGAMEPGYSPGRSTISALAAQDATHPWIVMAGLVAFGLGTLALAVALPARVTAVLFALAGAGFVVAAFARLPCDPAFGGCPSAAHGAATVIARL